MNRQEVTIVVRCSRSRRVDEWEAEAQVVPGKSHSDITHVSRPLTQGGGHERPRGQGVWEAVWTQGWRQTCWVTPLLLASPYLVHNSNQCRVSLPPFLPPSFPPFSPPSPPYPMRPPQRPPRTPVPLIASQAGNSFKWIGFASSALEDEQRTRGVILVKVSISGSKDNIQNTGVKMTNKKNGKNI
ncbi:hypothetical protein E2C01_006041 [Portunus trituberculatus]|uniref:Uncharacterized protein n=1 Tax=Portunus trituberculatus TaxID=210409 RepID=A0A5B7CV49_PORTR|nr:hypothetical protein [Portunus trituberculatus]